MDRSGERKAFAVLMGMIALIAACMAFRLWRQGAFFAFRDIGSDTIQQYVPQYEGVVRAIREGSFSSWDFTNGFGSAQNFVTLTNPMIMAVYGLGLIFGEGIVLPAMFFLYLACFFLAGGAAFLFLSRFSFGRSSRVIASFLYAFSGFLLTWGEHYAFGILPTLLPLLLWSVERYLADNGKWKMIVFISALITVNSTYGAYMIFLAAGVYCIFSVFRKDGGKGTKDTGKRFLTLIKTAGLMIIGLLIGGAVFMPSAMAILTSSGRLDAESSALERIFGASWYPDYYSLLFGRFFGTTTKGVNLFYSEQSNFFEAPCLWFGVLFPFLLVQYVFLLPKSRISLRGKCFHFAGLLIAAFAVLHPSVGVIFNGMSAPFTRFFFVIDVYFLLVSAFVIDEMIKRKRVSVIATLLTGAVMARQYAVYELTTKPHPQYVNGLMIICTVAAVVAFVLLWKGNEIWRKRVPAFLAAVSFAGAFLETGAVMSDRGYVTADDGYLEARYDEDTEKALSYIRETDSGFYRVEKMYGATLCMDGAAQRYMSVSTYSSVVSQGVRDYIDRFWPEMRVLDENHYSFAMSGYQDPDQASFAGVKYILRHSYDPEVEGYEAVATFGNVTVDRNKKEAGIVSLYSDVTEEGDKLVFDLSDRSSSDSFYTCEIVNDTTLRVTFSLVGASGEWCLITIPDVPGWKAYAGPENALEPLEIKTANEGFMAVEVTSGERYLYLAYTPPGRLAGIVMSTAGIVLFIVVALVRRKRHGVFA